MGIFPVQALHKFIPVGFGQNTGCRNGCIDTIPFDYTEMWNFPVPVKEMTVDQQEFRLAF